LHRKREQVEARHPESPCFGLKLDDQSPFPTRNRASTGGSPTSWRGQGGQSAKYDGRGSLYRPPAKMTQPPDVIMRWPRPDFQGHGPWDASPRRGESIGSRIDGSRRQPLRTMRVRCLGRDRRNLGAAFEHQGPFQQQRGLPARRMRLAAATGLDVHQVVIAPIGEHWAERLIAGPYLCAVAAA